MTQATLINCFEVAPEREREFLKLWGQADELLRTRGGYVTTRLHRALTPTSKYQYVNVAELGSVETWQSIITGPEFSAIATQLADFHPTPGLFQLAVARTGAPTPAASDA